MNAERQVQDIWQTTQQPQYQARPAPQPQYQPPHPGYAQPNWTARTNGRSNNFAAPAGPGPAIWPVILWTSLFGLFGAISAAGRARTAAALGLPGKYWIAFAATCAFWTALTVLIIVAGIALLSAAATY
ncbi:hypothetical protein [Actinoplanes sp. NPDC026619]|uniref:hypothetical protein n=1 Tax=Actinoplanes sp. NPDC026619 TaxID=3155798 RepID=UPI0033DA913D